MSRGDVRPLPAELLDLQPSNGAGLQRTAVCLVLTGAAFALSANAFLAAWLAGQMLLGLALVQWFVILHEAGHGTLFRSKWLHAPVGQLAGFFAGIPFLCWKRVHGRHHKWTGYQDLDPTTEALVPRPIKPIERALVNVCWGCSIPIFSVLYRLGNFWNIPRLFKLFRPREARGLTINSVVLLAMYVAITAVAGPVNLMRFAGLGILISLVIEDPLLLSQHTHVPQMLSQGHAVQPFPALEQETFTRSLRFPGWLSAFLLHFDAHELHHMYPFVPGYNLRRVPYEPQNEVGWWCWLRGAKQLRGEVFLFKNRNDTGFNL